MLFLVLAGAEWAVRRMLSLGSSSSDCSSSSSSQCGGSRQSQLLNEASGAVEEAIGGFVRCSGHVRKLAGFRVVVRADIAEYKKTRVALISGGGSGHEPAHGGYIGEGLLTAVVAGDVFASPSTASILAAIRAVTGPAGCLLIVKNYTGDRLNFGMAAERAKCEGLKVEMVIVGDDCALPRDVSLAGRRGLAGTVFVHKLAGAVAQQGGSLADVADAARMAAANIGTMGVSLSPCVLPGRGASFTVPAGSAELGLGIHGEPGVKQTPLASSKETVRVLIDTIISTAPDRNYLSVTAGSRVALMVNNLGGTSNLELGIVCNDALNYLVDELGIYVDRVCCGTFMTSIAMAGISISLFVLPEGLEVNGMSFLQLLSLPTNAPAWPPLSQADPSTLEREDAPDMPCPEAPAVVRAGAGDDAAIRLDGPAEKTLIALLTAICNDIGAAEPELTALDAAIGDGDCGYTMKAGADFVLQSLREGKLPTNHPVALLQYLGFNIADHMGGSSGALYSIFFASAAKSVLSVPQGVGAMEWATAIMDGASAISQYGGATVGDRTMLDALLPAAETFREKLRSGQSPAVALSAAADAARRGADKTCAMKPRAGRASYIEASRVQGTCDPGAAAVAIAFKAAAAALQRK
eukprot:m.61458 g.61458  ORF g.61458 m.61458 type:complete len:637 (-) comp7342_c0_seq1:1093-3003(-)